MTDTTIYPTHAHAPHNLISWPAVFAGAIVAVAVGAMLNLLGVALGAASFNPYDLDAGDAADFSAAAGMWMAVANALALFVGGVVASRAAKYPDHHRGGLHGLGVWGLAFLLALVIASAGAAGGAAAVAGGEASEPAPRQMVVTGPDGAPALVTDAPTVPSGPALRAADETADATATLALWGFLTMLLGAVAAVFGGMYGTRNHRWMSRAGLDGDVAVHPASPVPTTETPHRVYPTPRT